MIALLSMKIELVSLDFSRVLRFALIIEIIALLSAATAISRNYQDSWILEGLEIPFAVFMITYAIYVFIENKVTYMIPFALIFRSVLVLIPNLKYEWFLGAQEDQHMHYRLVQDIFNTGYIPSGRLYSETPNMHLSFTIYSLITNMSVLHSFKYLPILSWLIYPLVIYLIMKKLGFIENSSLLKYALFISSIPVKYTIGSYLVIGTLFGPLLSFLFLWQLIKVLQKKDRRDWIIAIIYILALVATHTYSSIMLMIVLLTISLMVSALRGRKLFNFRKISFGIPLAIVLINVAWLSHKATDLLESIVKLEINYIKRLMGFEVTVGTSIPSRFFELSFIDALKTVLVYHGGDILLMFLTLIGIVVIAKKFQTRSKSVLMFLSLYVVSLWMFLFIGVLVFYFGNQWYDRIIRLSLTVSPIISSIAIFHISKGRRNSKLAIFVISLMILATIEHYACQPLIPPASSVSKDLPIDEPVVYVNNVNSAYQIHMIKFTGVYFPQDALIACDKITSNQIVGLTNYTFSRTHLAWYYPFSKLLGAEEKYAYEKEYGYFLIHLPGKSGVFQEKAEIRTRSLILKALYNSSIVYTNGESCVLTEPFYVF